MRNSFAPLSNDNSKATEKDLQHSPPLKITPIMLKYNANYNMILQEEQRNPLKSSAKLEGKFKRPKKKCLKCGDVRCTGDCEIQNKTEKLVTINCGDENIGFWKGCLHQS
ncbi:hypothetical protein NPIL_497661 [Nephila pilipes]|uniref:Uncharacterized protein n=1 Tax=Nephila pilipes TaxID=299642 RepID=A0A8X6Q870_NEPPI|nr:hypothetical protein NPIL_497661 [Nephila pilipes]